MKSGFPHGRVVLVTGASSGIGAAAASLFAENGYVVYGASRRGVIPHTGGETAFPGPKPRPLIMDITRDDSVTAGVAEVLRNEGRLDILVHAAGDGLYGPIEASAAEDARRQMDVNYFGALRLLNAALPVMRKQGKGLVVLVGSVGGVFSIPYQTLYSSSKAAVAMLGDGLRLELKPFNIQSVVILPGDVRTGFTQARRPVRNPCPEAYRKAMGKAVSRMEQDEQNGVDPFKIARLILKAAQSRRPGARIVAGAVPRFQVFMNRVLPYAAVEWLIRRIYLG
ncbi:MAG: SDR family NAD(P)-dependent oxidoreductase [Treponema sp.]|jgi:NAD(P)-dependent dehydrogenase (short-subunit alcohol dehydrogenase family)|nr:SDR family NAD(P)-dependent oxidoreductase [Treponema sp.]